MAGPMISVACKIPNGLIIQHEQMVETKGTDGATTRVFVKIGSPVQLNGSNTARVIGGYGITDNIELDFFTKWLEAEKGSILLHPANPMVFAAATRDKTDGQAKELAATKSGFEPLPKDRPAPGIEMVDT